jgi:betaine-aldehyde dehydrogenase
MSEIPIPRRQLYVNGRWLEPVKGGTLPVINPATEKEIGLIPAATAEDVNTCISEVCVAAKSGHWTKTTGAYRATFLRAIAQKVRR